MMKSKESVNQLNEKNHYRHKVKARLGCTKDLHAIIMVRWVIHQTHAGAMVKKNSMQSVIVAIRMDIEKVNAQRNVCLKESVTIATTKDTNLQSVRPKNGTQQRKLSNKYLDEITKHGAHVTTMVSFGPLEKTM